MITTRTKSRLEGVDTTGDRWAVLYPVVAESAAADYPKGIS